MTGTELKDEQVDWIESRNRNLQQVTGMIIVTRKGLPEDK